MSEKQTLEHIKPSPDCPRNKHTRENQRWHKEGKKKGNLGNGLLLTSREMERWEIRESESTGEAASSLHSTDQCRLIKTVAEHHHALVCRYNIWNHRRFFCWMAQAQAQAQAHAHLVVEKCIIENNYYLGTSLQLFFFYF
jgi:hypothetical protein